jgi:hypothetical protein
VDQVEYFGRILEGMGWTKTVLPPARVRIDPNVRVRGNQTFVGVEDFEGQLTIGQQVRVYEEESGLEGDAVVTDFDEDKQLLYLRVDWPSLRPAEDVDEIDTTEDEFDAMWAEGEPVELADGL